MNYRSCGLLQRINWALSWNKWCLFIHLCVYSFISLFSDKCANFPDPFCSHSDLPLWTVCHLCKDHLCLDICQIFSSCQPTPELQKQSTPTSHIPVESSRRLLHLVLWEGAFDCSPSCSMFTSPPQKRNCRWKGCTAKHGYHPKIPSYLVQSIPRLSPCPHIFPRLPAACLLHSVFCDYTL